MAVLILVLAGCESEPSLVKVSGTVLIDGVPLTHGVVLVAPDGYRAAMGRIGPDGRFALLTGEVEGVIKGTHSTAVIAHETLGPGSQKWHAPKLYMSTETSGLVVTIDKSTNDLVIELTWAGGKPFIERGERE